MNALERGDQLNPKFYKNISPNFCEMLINFRKTHPIKLINFGNKKLEYISCGSGKKTILLFHGALGNAEGNFKDILQFEKTYRLIAPSITNFTNLSEFSDGINEILKKEGVQTIILKGQSFGSFIAQTYFHRNFEKIKALILVNSSPPQKKYRKTFQKTIKIFKLIPGFLLRRLLSRELFRLFKQDVEISPEIKEELEFTKAFARERFSKVEKSVIMSQVILISEFQSNEYYHIDDYSGWEGKVLIITANDDSGYPHHDELKGHYPHVEEHVFMNVGHMGTLLKREEYLTILNKFLNSLD